MAQTVDLGYVVGPTGPAGTDAVLPTPQQVLVTVLFNNEGPGLGFWYVHDYQFAHFVASEKQEPTAEYLGYTNQVSFECDYGTPVTLVFNVSDMSFDEVTDRFLPSRYVAKSCSRVRYSNGTQMYESAEMEVQPHIISNDPVPPSSSSDEGTPAQPNAVAYDVLCTGPHLYICTGVLS